MSARYRKLQDGSWGVAVEVEYEAKAGDTVEVTLKDGRVKTEKLGEFVKIEYGYRVFTIVKKAREVVTADVGNLSGVMALFDRAKAHLKYPAIVLSVPEANETIRISVAGDRAKVPGSLTVVSKDKTNAQGRKVWYGRVHTDGCFEQGAAAASAIANRLREFAADPAKVAGEHGRLTGHCCFCHLPLKDERSTAVGYGKVCANHFGMPWGERHEVFTAQAA